MTKYFAIIDGRQQGPFTLDQLAESGVRPDTYVWTKGMSDWEQASEDAEICRYFRNRLVGNIVDTEAEDIPDRDSAQEPGMDLPLRFRGIIEQSGTAYSKKEDTSDYSVRPPSLLIPAIAATIFCCPIIGFIAIYFSIRTSQLWKSGRHESAYQYHRKSKIWLGLTVSLGMIQMAILTMLLQ